MKHVLFAICCISSEKKEWMSETDISNLVMNTQIARFVWYENNWSHNMLYKVIQRIRLLSGFFCDSGESQISKQTTCTICVHYVMKIN